jgi:hypothetical protein
MATIDFKRLAAEISVQHGIRIDPDDPIMAVVTLNRLVLESAMGEAADRVNRAAREFNDGAERLQVRLGSTVARELRESAAGIQQDLLREMATFRLRGNEIVEAVDRAHSRASRAQWIVAGLFLAVLLFLAGVWAGRAVR